MKRHDLLRLFVVQKRKVLLLQAGDRFSRLVGHDHIERDAAMRTIRGTDAVGPNCPAGPFCCANTQRSEKPNRQMQIRVAKSYIHLTLG